MAYNNDGGQQGGFQRQTFKGNWKCGKCGAAITELPFEPDPEKSDRLKCRDCFRESKQSFGGGRPFRQ